MTTRRHMAALAWLGLAACAVTREPGESATPDASASDVTMDAPIAPIDAFIPVDAGSPFDVRFSHDLSATRTDDSVLVAFDDDGDNARIIALRFDGTPYACPRFRRHPPPSFPTSCDTHRVCRALPSRSSCF